MSRAISFIYDYPYCGYKTAARYGNQWSTNRITLNGCYTYPMMFNNTVPGCRHMKIGAEITNTGSGTVYGRSWDFMVYRQNYGWIDIETFTLPEGGLYTIDCDISNINIIQFAVVPSSNPGSSKTWDSWFGMERLTITEAVTTTDLISGDFQYGIFPNRYGITQQPNEVYVNIGGTLTKAKKIFVNIDGTLIELPKVYSGYFKTIKEEMKVFEFTPPSSGTYTITQKKISGDHEIRLYDSAFTPISESYFYNGAFALTGGSVFYISVIHYYNSAETGESYLQIYKN